MHQALVPFFSRPRAALRVLALLLACLCAAQAAGAMTLRELKALQKSDRKQGENYLRYYLVGAMEGVLEAQAQAVRDGAKESICLNGRRLEPAQAQTLYTTELKRNAEIYEADMPATLVLANALRTVYPC